MLAASWALLGFRPHPDWHCAVEFELCALKGDGNVGSICGDDMLGPGVVALGGGAERRILIGGEHAVPPDIFPPALSYVALGHLHRPQSLDGGRVRYSGSPFPLSAAEIAYDHGVTLLDLDHGFALRHIPLPRPVAMHCLPARGTAPLAEVAAGLAALALPAETKRDAQPFVFLSLLADPSLWCSTRTRRRLADNKG